MITLLSALLGFTSSATPDILKMLRDRSDRAHELAILQLQMDYDREKLAAQKEQAAQDYAYKLQEISVTERQALNGGAGTRDGLLGIQWVDALAGSVRPIITYSFFLLYSAVKLCQF